MLYTFPYKLAEVVGRLEEIIEEMRTQESDQQSDDESDDSSETVDTDIDSSSSIDPAVPANRVVGTGLTGTIKQFVSRVKQLANINPVLNGILIRNEVGGKRKVISLNRVRGETQNDFNRVYTMATKLKKGKTLIKQMIEKVFEMGERGYEWGVIYRTDLWDDWIRFKH